MRSTCRGEFFKSGVWNKVPEGSTLIFGELAEASDKKKKLVGGASSGRVDNFLREHSLQHELVFLFITAMF